MFCQIGVWRCASCSFRLTPDEIGTGRRLCEFQSMMTFPEEYQASLEHLDSLLENHGDELAAVIIEPMVQGAGGMRMHSAEFLKTLATKVQERGILLITDEVMTGFGRTGKLFAVEHAGVSPDIMCVAKGLTGGILPLAVTMATDEIYSAFFSDDTRKAFLHGHSFTANPIACAAARASLQIFRDEPVLERIARLEEVYQARLPKLACACCSC